jgi:hypothetical protein
MDNHIKLLDKEPSPEAVQAFSGAFSLARPADCLKPEGGTVSYGEGDSDKRYE